MRHKRRIIPYRQEKGLKSVSKARKRAGFLRNISKFRRLVGRQSALSSDSRQKIGVGLACGTEKGSYVACCARIEVEDSGTFKVLQVCEAFECGAIQNPANLKAQIEGCIIMGLGGALREEMRF